MADGGCANCSKVLLFIFNFLFFFSGLGLLGVGVWGLVDPSIRYLLLLDLSFFNTVAIMSIVGGSLALIVSFLGCVGAMKESKCMLITFAVCQFIIFGLMLSAGIVGLVYKDRVVTEMSSSMSTIIDGTEKFEDRTTEFQNSMKSLQIIFKCCGYSSYNNWRSPGSVTSCDCSGESDTATYCDGTTPAYYRACESQFTDYLSWGVQTVAIVTICLSSIPLIGFFMALCLVNGIGKNDVGPV
ncbi:tetraspanin-8-like [Branchiostoma floridae]|uniref:Tetraspanin n=1 Tax=Branchiostoma floridae TaxID=7739 RepID=A0A9J7MPX2_BRAFL|nr:tetraspanin-8-like [Branchiostoma floridae]